MKCSTRLIFLGNLKNLQRPVNSAAARQGATTSPALRRLLAADMDVTRSPPVTSTTCSVPISMGVIGGLVQPASRSPTATGGGRMVAVIGRPDA